MHLVAIDELADLAAQVVHHLEQFLIGRAGRAAIELEHTQTFAAHQDGNGKAATQAVGRRGRRSWKVRVLGQLADPGALATRPDPAGKSQIGSERGPASHLLEVWHRHVGRMPDGDAAHLASALFQSPERPEVPVECRQTISKIKGMASVSESTSERTRVASYWTASRRSFCLRGVMS